MGHWYRFFDPPQRRARLVWVISQLGRLALLVSTVWAVRRHR